MEFRVCHSRHFFKEHDGHVILSCPSHVGITWHQSFSILPGPHPTPSKKKTQLTPIMKPELKLFARNLKIAQSDVC